VLEERGADTVPCPMIAIRDAPNLEPAFLAALAATRTITRGPKPARALREVKLAPDVPADEPTGSARIRIV